MSNPTLEDIRGKPRPHQLRPSVIYACEKAADSNTEFLLEQQPYCLLSSSTTFRFTFFRELTHYASPFDPLELEQLTLLSYKMSIISLHQQLWSIYLQSGTGQLEKSHPSRRHDDTTDLHYWPTYLHSFTLARAFAKTIDGDTMDYETHVELVKKYLSHLEEQHHLYLTQFDAVTSEMPLYTPALGYQIEECVRKHALTTVNIYFDMVTTLLKHDYMDRFMQLQCLGQEIHQEQVYSFRVFGLNEILNYFSLRFTRRIASVN